MTVSIALIPFVTALIGWVTNVVAVKMLFHPREPYYFFRFKVQGAVPRRLQALARALAEVIGEKLIGKEGLSQQFEQLDFQEEAGQLLEERMDAFASSLKAEIPMASLFLSPQLEAEIKGKAMREVTKMIPDLQQKVSLALAEKVNVQEVIYKKVMDSDLDYLEALVNHVVKKELRLIEVLGGILGFMIGLVQVALIWLL